jgi:hypothetical protein
MAPVTINWYKNGSVGLLGVMQQALSAQVEKTEPVGLSSWSCVESTSTGRALFWISQPGLADWWVVESGPNKRPDRLAGDVFSRAEDDVTHLAAAALHAWIIHQSGGRPLSKQ